MKRLFSILLFSIAFLFSCEKDRFNPLLLEGTYEGTFHIINWAQQSSIPVTFTFTKDSYSYDPDAGLPHANGSGTYIINDRDAILDFDAVSDAGILALSSVTFWPRGSYTYSQKDGYLVLKGASGASVDYEYRLKKK